MNKLFIITASVLVILLALGAFLFMSREAAAPTPGVNLPAGEGIACTMDAKICPDGSAVGRIPPTCKFAACPGERDDEAVSGTLSGRMTIGPVCPVEREGEVCKPTPEMYAARKVLVYKSDKKTLVTALTPNREGNFSATLVAGTYYVDMERQSSVGNTSGVPITITITAGQTTNLNIDVDTGIR